MKIGRAFFAGDFGDGAFDEDLAFKGDPREDERDAGVEGELAAFAAFVVRIENKAPPIEALQQHGAGGRPTVRRGGGQRHGVGLGKFGGFGFLKPFFKLAERIAREVFFGETGEGVVFAEIGQTHVERRSARLGEACQKSLRKSKAIYCGVRPRLARSFRFGKN